jgi:hypothetical protein
MLLRRERLEPSMSQMDQARSFGDVGPMSGFPKSGNAGHRQIKHKLLNSKDR